MQRVPLAGAHVASFSPRVSMTSSSCSSSGYRCGRPRLAAVVVVLISLPAPASARLFGSLTDAFKTPSATAGARTYTENNFCFEKFCINPIIPGLLQYGQNVLSMNMNKSWACVDSSTAWRNAGFCSQVVSGYTFSLPDSVDAANGVTPDEIMAMQEKAAVTAYVAHLAAMGHDFWDYTEPWNEDDCIRAVWKMSCYTHFPRCNLVSEGVYLRPCASSCQDYLRTCQVECCDEGVQCVFTHQKTMDDGTVLVEEGYVDHSGPSPLCTGAAAPRRFEYVVTVVLALGFSAMFHTP